MSGEFATKDDLHNTELRIIDHFDEKFDSFVTEKVCIANHRYLDASKLWLTIGAVAVLEVIVLAQAFAH